MDVTEDAQIWKFKEHNNVAVPVDTIVSMEEDDAHVEEPADTMEVESQDNEGEERIEANIVGDSLDDHSVKTILLHLRSLIIYWEWSSGSSC